MSTVLLDFVDRLVGSASEEDGDLTTTINAVNEAWWETAASINGTNNEYDDDATAFCSVPEVLFEDFVAEDFSNTNIIRWMHTIPPRFGRSDNVLDLMLGTQDQKDGGLLFLCLLANLVSLLSQGQLECISTFAHHLFALLFIDFVNVRVRSWTVCRSHGHCVFLFCVGTAAFDFQVPGTPQREQLLPVAGWAASADAFSSIGK